MWCRGMAESKDYCDIKTRIPGDLKQAIAAASAAQFQSESEFIRQAVITRLKEVGRLESNGAAA